MPFNPQLSRIVLLSALVLCALALEGACGYVGDPLPPALYIPMPVENLDVIQEGGEIVIRFTLPARTTEDLPFIGTPEIDLRAATWENREWDEGAWEREARRLPATLDDRDGLVRTPVNGFVGRRMLLRVRVAGPKRRFSAWSQPVALRVLDRQPAPAGLSATATSEGVALQWTLANAVHPNSPTVVEVWRRQGAESDFRLVARSPTSPYIDAGSLFGEPHSYRLRTRVEADEQLALSPFTEAVNVIPVDRFPPATPADLSAIAGSASIELSWSRNMEADFLAYQVYRATGDGDFVPLGEPTASSTFSDASAPKGLLLHYRVTARDLTGNESEGSAIVEVTLP